MKIKFSTYRIKLNHSFGISRSSNDFYDIIYVYLIGSNIIGRGEAAPSLRYNESTEKILSVLKNGISLIDNFQSRDELWSFLKPQLMGISSLEAAVNMALWDWWSQKKNKAVYDILKLNVKSLPKTSFTIAIGEMNELDEKVQASSPYSILKVKLGTPENDKEIIRQIRLKTDKIIRVDANEGWTYDMAKEMSFWLADRNVEFIEQPFPADKLYDTELLKKVSPLPLYADENSIVSKDIREIESAFDGINIKLMKCGGIDEALNMIKVAKELNMKIMLGCMVESSVGITAAAHLASMVDVVDLDGNLLISNDPYAGVSIKDGRLMLSANNTGMGLTLINKEEGLM